MALGYCMVCDELRTIRPGPQKWGSRECAWYPTPHWFMIHNKCSSPVPGKVRDLSQPGENVSDYVCVFCGPILKIEVSEERCPGETKEIK